MPFGRFSIYVADSSHLFLQFSNIRIFQYTCVFLFWWHYSGAIVRSSDSSSFFCFFTLVLVLFLPCPSLPSPLLSLLSLFSLSLGDDTKWPTRVDVLLNPNTTNQITRYRNWAIAVKPLRCQTQQLSSALSSTGFFKSLLPTVWTQIRLLL